MRLGFKTIPEGHGENCLEILKWVSACLNAYFTSRNYVRLCDTLRVHYRQATISSAY